MMFFSWFWDLHHVCHAFEDPRWLFNRTEVTKEISNHYAGLTHDEYFPLHWANLKYQGEV